MTEIIGNAGQGLVGATNAAAARQRASAASMPQSGRASGTLDMITLTKSARAAAALMADARAATAGKTLSLNPKGLNELDAMMAEAQSGIQDMLQALGIVGDTALTISVRPDGSVSVNSDHPRAAEIEAAINGDPGLRNALVGVHVMASTRRIADAMGQAMAAARADEGNAGAYFNWVRGIIAQTNGADQVFTMTGGSLSTSFVDTAGNRFGISDGLTLTA